MKKTLFILSVLFFMQSCGGLCYSQTQQRASLQPVPTNSLKIGGYFPAVAGQSAGLFEWDSLWVRRIVAISLNGFTPKNGTALDTVEFQNRLLGLLDTNNIVKWKDTLTYIETRHRTNSLIEKIFIDLDTATIARTNRANHFTQKQWLDSLKLSNIGTGYIPYQNGSKFVNSPISTNGRNVDVGYVSAHVVDFYSESHQNNDIQFTASSGSIKQVSQSFTGDGTVLMSCQFYLKKTGGYIWHTGYGEKAISQSCRAILYRHSGTMGISSMPDGTVLDVSDSRDVVYNGNFAQRDGFWYHSGNSAEGAELMDDWRLETFYFYGNVLLQVGVNYEIVFECDNVIPGILIVYAGEETTEGINTGHNGNVSQSNGSWAYPTDANYINNSDLCFYVNGITPIFGHKLYVGGTTYFDGNSHTAGSDTITGNLIVQNKLILPSDDTVNTHKDTMAVYRIAIDKLIDSTFLHRTELNIDKDTLVSHSTRINAAIQRSIDSVANLRSTLKRKDDTTNAVTGYTTLYQLRAGKDSLGHAFVDTTDTYPDGTMLIKHSGQWVAIDTSQIGGGGGGFKWNVSGEVQKQDSIRFIAGAGISLTQVGNTITIAYTGGGGAISMFEIDINGDLMPKLSSTVGGLFEIDESNGLMPTVAVNTDTYFEVDLSDGIEPI